MGQNHQPLHIQKLPPFQYNFISVFFNAEGLPAVQNINEGTRITIEGYIFLNQRMIGYKDLQYLQF